MLINKVVRKTANGEETLIDLTGDTVTPANLLKGITAHDASGAVITGTVPILGYIDANKNLVLKGEVAEDTYTVKYEKADGTIVDIGELALKEQIINQLEHAIDASGNPYNNGQGYKTNTRLSGSSGGESTSSATGIETTGFIRVNYGDTVYIENITPTDASCPATPFVWFYKSDFSKIASNSTDVVFKVVDGTDGRVRKMEVTSSGVALDAITASAGVYYMRFSAWDINANSIITVNQQIS